ncbi:uncharacterized protein N7525_008030 [Penicillium rubens]|uniref:uncharacterized protein n=1 Tax=Penicillium rubens TaxID=1108849 RepID=UPI002A5B1097|nr:uncharacterized protein N7525_008030 [Penicillium rubens]KAJ5829777.1 hypothetical protein N7525_008030 [Penicillium rubens]
MTGSGRWTRKPTAASKRFHGTSVKYGRTIVILYTMIFFFCIHKCFDPEEMLDSMPKLQSKSPTPQTESQYIPTQIKTVNSPTLPMKECRKGAKYLKCNAKSRANPTQMSSRKKAQGGEGERKKSEIFDNANPPAPSNPMHQNRRIPYTNAYQRISTNAETRHNAGLQYGQHKRERPVREWGVK